ncbi:MAG: GxxExxY protein [Myxococcales bacterium]|nr:GxxExxY protein [Myxococcales bacterium]
MANRITEEPPPRLNELSGAVLDAALEVHRALGPGFPESVYERALASELGLRGLPFERQQRVQVVYKGQVVGVGRVDLLVGECLIVELKAVEELAAVHVAQVLSYLRASGCQLGLLINFNVSLLRHGVRRIVLSGVSAGER